MSTTPTRTAAVSASPVHTVTERDAKWAIIVCFLAWTVAVYDFVLFGNLLPVIAEDLGWSSARSTSVNTWVTVGTALVAFGIGPIIDRIGRRRGIAFAVIGAAIASVLTAVVGWVAVAVAGIGLVLLVLVRSIAGLGYAEQAVNAAYLSEILAHTHNDPVKARRRGLIYSLVQSGWPVGSVIAAGSIYFFLPIGGWHLCFVLAAIPSVAIGLAALRLKESPQFLNLQHARSLVAAGRQAEAAEFAEAAGVALTDKAAPVADAFRGESLRATVVIGTAFLLNWMGVLTFVILGTSLLTADDGKGIEFDNALLVLAVSNATAFAGYLFHGWLGDRIGRRNTIAIGWMLSAVSFAAMLSLPQGSTLAVIALYSAGLFFLLGPFAALLFFNGESFPVRTRATGGSIINAAGQLGAVLGGAIITAVLAADQTWTQAAFWWGCLPILASAVIVLFARNISPDDVRVD